MILLVPRKSDVYIGLSKSHHPPHDALLKMVAVAGQNERQRVAGGHGRASQPPFAVHFAFTPLYKPNFNRNSRITLSRFSEDFGNSGHPVQVLRRAARAWRDFESRLTALWTVLSLKYRAKQKSLVEWQNL